MTKVKIFSVSDAVMLADVINEFIKDKKVVDIKYQAVIFYDEFNRNGTPQTVGINDRAMVIYEEPDEETSFQEDLDFFVNECTNAQLVTLYKEVERKMKEKGL